jgi:hypothetical protein
MLYPPTGNRNQNVSFTFLTAVLAAGSHTVTAYVKCDSSCIVRADPRGRLSVMEV